MSMISHVCRECGRVFDFPLHLASCPCPGCQAIHERPKSEGESLTWLRRANEERANCDYTNAEANYRQVLGRHPEEHEALWGLVMCKYGVEMVEGKPTIHFMRKQPILSDPDYLQACKLAKPEVAAEYRAVAKYIHEIHTGLPEPGEGDKYDIFLCYKSSGKTEGTYAREHNYAFDLYDDLTKEGYRVFFAYKTLKDVAGARYEAQIFHALYSSKAMLVVCSDPQNLNTPWVHSEWTRYLERIYAGEKCLLLPMLYDNCNPYSMPYGLQPMGGITVGPSNWWKQLMTSLEKVLKPEQKAAPKKEDALAMTRMRLSVEYALKSRDWGNAAARARAYCEQYPDRAEGYMYQLLAKLQLPTADNLAGQLEPFEDDVDWQFAMQQATEEQAAAWSAVLEKSRALRQQKEEERLAEIRRVEEEKRRIEEARRAEQTKWDTTLTKCVKLSEMGAWNAAAEDAESLTQLRKGNYQGYLMRLLVGHHLVRPEALATCTEPFEEHADWAQTIKCAPPDMKKKLQGFLQKSKALRVQQEQERQEAQRRRAEQERQEAEARKAEEERIEKERREAEQAAWNAALKEAQQLRDARDWQKALDKAEQLIQMRGHKSEGYVARLLAKLKLKGWEDLAGCMEPFEWEPDWKCAMENATRAQKPKLEGYLSQSRALREKEKKAREAREKREEQDRLYAEGAARVKELLRRGDWEQAWAEAGKLPDRVEKLLLQLLAQHHLHDEDELATADTEVFYTDLYNEYIKEAGEARREKMQRYRSMAHAREQKLRKKKLTTRSFWATLLSLLGLGGYFFALEKLPDMAPVITMGAAAAAAVLMLLLWCRDRRLTILPKLLWGGAIVGVAFCAATLWTLPAWAYYLIALAMVAPALYAGCAKSESCCCGALPVAWLMTVIDLALAAMLPGASLAVFLSGVVSAWWFALLVVLANLLLVANDAIGSDIDMDEFACGWTLLLPVMLLPNVIVGLEALLPAWAGVIALGTAVLLLAIYIVARIKDSYGGEGGTALSAAIVLTLVTACAASFLSLPLWVYLCAALVVTGVTLGFAAAKLEDSSAAVMLPGLWLLLHLVCMLLDVFIDAAWLTVASDVIGGWIPPVVVFLAALLASMEVNVSEGIGAVLLGVLCLAAMGVALAVLAVPTYGVVVLQHYLPEWTGLIAFGGALLAFMIYAINRHTEKYSGGWGMIVLGVLLIIATVIVTIFWPLPQLTYLIAAGVLSLILVISSLVSLVGIDPVPWPLPATIWLTLHCGAYLLCTFVPEQFAVALNITRWWLPGAAVLAWVIAIVWCIGDDEGWW